MANPAIASTAIGVVPPARAGMASGINSTFRQVGIATGVAGARRDLPVADRLRARVDACPQAPSRLRRRVSVGGRHQAVSSAPPQFRDQARIAAANHAFITGFNEILLIGAAIAVVGGILGLALVRASATSCARPPARTEPARSPPPPRPGAPNPSVPAPLDTAAMLHELRIENLLLIERAELRLGEGLNAITGETGAGKTILAHSLDLLMGGRARPQIVRPGAGEAYVEGVFALPGRPARRPRAGRARRAAPPATPTRSSSGAASAPPGARAPSCRAARRRPPTCARSARGCSPSTASTSTAS